MAKKRKTRARQKPAAPIPYGGDHGPKTHAATAGTYLEEIKNDKGENPNHIARRRRKSAIDALSLTMRQGQAARAIEEAWCRLESCSSGSPLKQKVQASPKPDAVIDMLVAAQGRWIEVTSAVLMSDMPIVRHVCCENRPITEMSRRMGIVRAQDRFRKAMDRVADRLRF